MAVYTTIQRFNIANMNGQDNLNIKGRWTHITDCYLWSCPRNGITILDTDINIDNCTIADSGNNGINFSGMKKFGMLDRSFCRLGSGIAQGGDIGLARAFFHHAVQGFPKQGCLATDTALGAERQVFLELVYGCLDQ